MTRATAVPETVTIHVPFRIVKRGGRKAMQMPEGAAQPRRADSTLVKALARAFRWRRMLESGEFATIAELAEREGIAPLIHDPRSASDPARARNRRGDPGRQARASGDVGASHGAALARMGGAEFVASTG
jgi:hypothetical protein